MSDPNTVDPNTVDPNAVDPNAVDPNAAVSIPGDSIPGHSIPGDPKPSDATQAPSLDNGIAGDASATPRSLTSQVAGTFPVAAITYAVTLTDGTDAAPIDGIVAHLGHILAGLKSPVLLTQTGRAAWRWRFVDTFDGRIHRAGGALAVVAPGDRATATANMVGAADPADKGSANADGDRAAGWLLWQAHDGEVLHAVPWSGPPPAFAGDIPDRSFSAWMTALTTPRRLLPLADVVAEVRAYDAVDGDGKTVLRLRLGEGTAVGGGAPSADGGRAHAALTPWLEVGRVKGGKAALKAVRAACAALVKTGDLAESASGVLVRAQAALGEAPGGVSAKFDVPLAPTQRADDAAATVFQVLLGSIRATEAGTRADLDPEFLHDFRVAVRRTRAGLTLLQDALPAADVTRFKTEFGWLGAATGPTRDLDVYLENMGAYRAALPATVRRDLAPLETYLRERQAEAHAALVAELDSPRYAALLSDWATGLEGIRAAGAESGATGLAQTGPAAAEPIAALAAKRTWKRFKRVLDDGRAITPATSVEALHALRIEAKKLRYALEFFRRLVPAAEADALIASLKGLQENLGTLNDMGVQQATLRSFAADMRRRRTETETLLAMGWLLANLSAREQACRHEFAARFRAFNTKANRTRYERLFREGSGKADKKRNR